MTTSLIVARARNNVIGRDGGMPWHLPADLKYFKAVTMGKPVIMGRRTFESIGRPLPGRDNVVISRQEGWGHAGTVTVHSLEAALDRAAAADEAMVIGGAQIYAQALPLADRLYITEIDAEVDGDTVFPEFDETDWDEIGRRDVRADAGCPALAFRTLQRR